MRSKMHEIIFFLEKKCVEGGGGGVGGGEGKSCMFNEMLMYF